MSGSETSTVPTRSSGRVTVSRSSSAGRRSPSSRRTSLPPGARTPVPECNPLRTPSPSLYPRPPSTASRLGTAATGRERPMSSYKGAGYNARDTSGGWKSQQVGRQEESKSEEDQREMILRSLEARIHDLIDSVASHSNRGDTSSALRDARDARKLEETFASMTVGEEETRSELSASVWLTLAIALERKGLDNEAMETYKALVTDQRFDNSSRFRINLGNLHFRNSEYAKAIKVYKMAVDRMHESQKNLKYGVTKNIAAALMKMGKVKQAVEQYERLAEQQSVDKHLLVNLLCCYDKLGDLEAMQSLFRKALMDLADKYETESRNSTDREFQKQKELNQCLIDCAEVISAKMQSEGSTRGHDWCIEELRQSGFIQASHGVLLSKADALISLGQYDQAIHIYEEAQQRDPSLQVSSAGRLACLYSLKGDQSSAAQSANAAASLDRFSEECWIHKGNVHFTKKELSLAKSSYEEALQLNPESIEALYNYGLANKQIGLTEEDDGAAASLLQKAESTFRRIHAMLPDFEEAVFQVGHLCELANRCEEAVEWFEVLHGLVPEDAGILAKLGALHFELGDEARAVHYYQQAHENYPHDMDVLCWLAVFCVNNEMYEKATEYFKHASQLQPDEIKWELMVASCCRRAGQLHEAFQHYADIHQRHPDSIECLRFLLQLCDEVGKGHLRSEFEEKLQELEKSQASRMSHQTKQTTHSDQLPKLDPSHFTSLEWSLSQAGNKQAAKESSKDTWNAGAIHNNLLPL